MPENFDIVVVGGGPAGYVAAIRASQLGMKTALIEREHLGGICLNWGCIPTKALLRSSEVNKILHGLDEFGLSATNISFDIEKIVARSRGIAKKLNAGVAHLLNKNKVTVFDGHGRFAGHSTLSIAGKNNKVVEVKASKIILATGARARALPGLEPDGKKIWTYREAMVPTAMPKSLMIVGSGAIGMEFASFYRDLGVQVTVVEVLDRILPVEDEEISALARKSFESQGMTIHTETRLKSIKSTDDAVTALIQTNNVDQNILVERVILAVGILGNVEDLGIDDTEIKVADSHVITDEWGETDEKGVFAIGDLAGPPWLAHKASHEGIVCVEHIAGLNTQPLNPMNVPGCIYCHPQISSVGFTEAAAKKAGYDVKIGKFPFLANGKAIALGDVEGLVKTIFDANSGALLGAHLIGPEVTEMIQGYAVARASEATEEELMQTIFPHPTLSEAMHEAVLGAYGRGLHF